MTVRGGIRRKKPKTQEQHMKSAWAATALLTLQNVYAAVTAPTLKTNITEDAQNTSNFEDMPIGTLPYIPPRKDIGISGTCHAHTHTYMPYTYTYM